MHSCNDAGAFTSAVAFLRCILTMSDVYSYLEQHCQTFDDRVSFVVSKLAVVRRYTRIAAFACVAGFIFFAIHACALFRAPEILLYFEFSLFAASAWVTLWLSLFGQKLAFLHRSFVNRKTIFEALAQNRVTKKN